MKNHFNNLVLVLQNSSKHFTESKFCFSHFTLFRVECEEMFWKSNIKSLKLIKN